LEGSEEMSAGKGTVGGDHEGADEVEDSAAQKTSQGARPGIFTKKEMTA